jgi:hypothetical protein
LPHQVLDGIGDLLISRRALPKGVNLLQQPLPSLLLPAG